jgi:ubiquinone/menaquinone biosynthesis C-methylase UbiE
MNRASIEKAIKIEQLRQNLAQAGDYKNLLEYYTKEYPEIPNFNNAKYWDRRNFTTDTSKENNPMAWDKTSILVEWIKSSLKLRRVLDIGFGPGVLENRFLPKSNIPEWYGIDISQTSIDYVTNKFPSGKFFKQAITSINFRDNYFDLVVASEVLEHISPYVIFKALKETRRVLKRGGTLLVSVPLNEGLDELLRQGKNPIQHVRMYTSKLLEAELRMSGFEVTRSKFLYAFNTHYRIKSWVAQHTGIRHPNNLVICAIKW